jgi:hypothetical protein
MFKKENLYLLVLPLCAVIAALAVRIDNPTRLVFDIQTHTVADPQTNSIVCNAGLPDVNYCIDNLTRICLNSFNNSHLIILKSEINWFSDKTSTHIEGSCQ